MRLYFDTAYLAKCYLNELDGTEVRKLARRASGLYSSAWCVAELSCVFQRQVREGRLEAEEAVQWRDTFMEDVRNGVWVLFPVSEYLLYRVESLTRALPAAAYLRAGDAIHLVTAADAGFTELWSNDRHLLAAARYFGLEGRTIRSVV